MSYKGLTNDRYYKVLPNFEKMYNKYMFRQGLLV